MPEPAIGRVGYVFDGFGNGDKIPGKSIRCNGCREWFPEAPACPACGTPRPGFNKWIRTAQLNNHLFAQVANAEKQKRRLV
jgi:hypothetical protein